MVADTVDVFSRRAGSGEAHRWTSDGQGTFSIAPAAVGEAPARGTRVVLHLMADAKVYLERELGLAGAVGRVARGVGVGPGVAAGHEHVDAGRCQLQELLVLGRHLS